VTLNRETLGKFVDLSDPKVAALVNVLEPYFPALQRMGNTGIQQFLASLKCQDWSSIDAALYEVMTETERDAMSAQVLKEARAAVKREYETSRLFKDDLLQTLLGIALSFV